MKTSFSPIPSRESCHAQQLFSLLQITQALQPYLLIPSPEVGAEAAKLNEQAEAAAVKSFTGACRQIDEILADKSRWSLTPQDELYESLVKTQQEQQEFLRAQTAAANGLQRPSYLLRPVLASFNNEYLAIWGNSEVAGGSIIGRGPTPAAALADFDAAFFRTPDKQVQIIADQSEKSRKKKSK